MTMPIGQPVWVSAKGACQTNTRETNNAMREHREDEFLAWAERSGFQIDRPYAEVVNLTFYPTSEHDRFWQVPDPPDTRPQFIASLLECTRLAGLLHVEALGKLAAVCGPERNLLHQ